jgi:hypothetical protein
MTEVEFELPQEPAQRDTASTAGSSPPRAKGGSNKRGGRSQDSSEDRRRRKLQGSDKRAMSGFGDGIERAFCTSLRRRLPPAFPVQHRTGLAVILPAVVARRSHSILLCDCEHDGPHSWPDGETVDVAGA